MNKNRVLAAGRLRKMNVSGISYLFPYGGYFVCFTDIMNCGMRQEKFDSEFEAADAWNKRTNDLRGSCEVL